MTSHLPPTRPVERSKHDPALWLGLSFTSWQKDAILCAHLLACIDAAQEGRNFPVWKHSLREFGEHYTSAVLFCEELQEGRRAEGFNPLFRLSSLR